MTSFGDALKPSSDLLNKEYQFDKKFKLTAKTANGVKLTTEGALKPKLASGSISTSFKAFDGINVDKLAVTTDGRFKGEASLSDALKNFKFIVKAEDGAGKSPSGKLACEYKKDNVRVDAHVDVTDGPTLYTAATYTHDDSYLVGGEVKYNSMFDDGGAPTLEDYNAVVGYAKNDLSVALKTANKLSVLKLGAHHRKDSKTQYAWEVSFNQKSGAKSLVVGAAYDVDSDTTVQGKVNSDAVVSANLIQAMSKQVKLVASAQVDARNFASDSHKFGLQLVLG